MHFCHPNISRSCPAQLLKKSPCIRIFGHFVLKNWLSLFQIVTPKIHWVEPTRCGTIANRSGAVSISLQSKIGRSHEDTIDYYDAPDCARGGLQSPGQGQSDPTADRCGAHASIRRVLENSACRGGQGSKRAQCQNRLAGPGKGE